MNARSSVRGRQDPAALPQPVRHDAERRRRVVVTGLGAVSPLGGDVPQLWQGLLDGRCGVSVVSGPEFDGLPVRLAARAAIEPAELFPKPVARRMNRSTQFAVLAAREAWRDAGLDVSGTVSSGLRPSRTGVSIGTIIGGAPVLVESRLTLNERGPRAVSPYTTPMIVPSASAARISTDLDIRGEARTVVSACASGTEAIGQAIDAIRTGRLDLVVAGGTEAVITPEILAAFAALRAVSTRNDQPADASRPFDARRDGFVLGEGSRRTRPGGRGTRPRARRPRLLRGGGLGPVRRRVPHGGPRTPGPRHRGRAASGPRGRGGHARRRGAHQRACHRDGGGGPHGGPRVGPPLRPPHPRRPRHREQGRTGSPPGRRPSGVEAIATVLTLRDGLIPPTVGCDDPEEGLGLDVVRSTPRPLPPCGDIVLSNSFGFGGHNAVLAFRRL